MFCFLADSGAAVWVSPVLYNFNLCPGGSAQIRGRFPNGERILQVLIVVEVLGKVW